MTPKDQADNREHRRSILDEIMTAKGHKPRNNSRKKIKDIPEYGIYMYGGKGRVKMPDNGSTTSQYKDEVTLDDNGVLACNIFIKSDRPIVEGRSRRNVKIGLEDLFNRRRCHTIPTLTIVNSLNKHGDTYNLNVQHYARLKRLPTSEEFQGIIPTIKKSLIFAD